MQTPFAVVAAAVAAVYLGCFCVFAACWLAVAWTYPTCLYGSSSGPEPLESYILSISTHMAIGYGNVGPQKCWLAAALITVQSIISMLSQAITLGILFAKVSVRQQAAKLPSCTGCEPSLQQNVCLDERQVANPSKRGRSIFISDTALIGRRDGILKFMFRVADVRRTHVRAAACSPACLPRQLSARPPVMSSASAAAGHRAHHQGVAVHVGGGSRDC